MTPEKIGFVGLGQMGQPMALNLLKAGYDLCVYDLQDERATPLVALARPRHGAFATWPSLGASSSRWSRTTARSWT